MLYEGLINLAPSLGSFVARAVAVGYAQSPKAGITALDQLAAELTERFQPWWAARAHLLWIDECKVDALIAIDKAIALEINLCSRQYLIKKKTQYQS
jgi:RNA polymerase sigma-70 factor, ECF subfamily